MFETAILLTFIDITDNSHHPLQTFGLHLKSSSEKYRYRQISHSFDSLVLLTSVLSETSILSKNNIYNIQTIC